MPPTLTRRGLLKFAAFAATARFSEVMGAGRTWQLGSNTAIEGFGLIEAIRTVREIGFTAIEIHPMGVIEPMPGKFPGFQFDKLDSSVRHQIREALKGFQRVTTHLPYTGLNYMSDSREAREPSIRAVEIAMEATAFFGAISLCCIHNRCQMTPWSVCGRSISAGSANGATPPGNSSFGLHWRQDIRDQSINTFD